MPVTVKVNLPVFRVRGEVREALPRRSVVLETVPLTAPDQVPVTVAPDFVAPV
jgi:hypothetical protein